MSDSRHPRWHDLRTLLTDWLTWLDETQQWVEATADADGSEVCDQAVEGTETDVTASVPPEAETSHPDLFALLATMTALRQEVNLQTRSARRDREQAAQTLEQLSSLVTQLEQERQERAKRRAAQAADAVHVDALLELHDALSRAERQASHLTASSVATLRHWGAWEPVVAIQRCDEPSEQVDGPDPANAGNGEAATPPWWRRWFGRPAAPDIEIEAAVDIQTPPDLGRGPDPTRALAHMAEEARYMADRLEALITGYGLSVQRLERLLATCGIEPLNCLDQAVDPELMEVVQVVANAELPPGTVTDEVRRGYRRHNRLYRFAQVVATRADPSARLESGYDLAPTEDAMADESCSP
jgi:molecular chaperone GrpE